MKDFLSAGIVLLATLAIGGCGSSGGNGSSNTTAAAPTNTPSSTASNTPSNAASAPAREAASNNHVARTNANPRTNGNGRNANPRPNANGRNANARQDKVLPKSPDVSILKLDASEVPAAVRAIETLIDRRSALLADEVRIEVSKNYEWDVSLSGDGVMPQKPDRGGTISEASGNPRAYFRNLDIRARQKIVVWRSGLGVTPFIKIWAKGGVSYIDTDDATGKPRIKRGNACSINNARIAFDDQMIGMPDDTATAQPTGLKTR